MKREKEVERERESGRSWHNANWSSGLATALAASTAVQTWPKQSSKREIKVGNKLDCGLSEPRRILIGKRGRLESFQKADISELTIPKNTILLLSFLATQLLKFRPIILPLLLPMQQQRPPLHNETFTSPIVRKPNLSSVYCSA